MQIASRFAASVTLTVAVACSGPVVTRPYPVSSMTAIERLDLALPSDVDVRSAGYSITGLANVSGINGTTSSEVQVRPLLTVYAVNRKTGERLIFIYEDLTQRKQPSQIIRLVASSDSSGR